MSNNFPPAPTPPNDGYNPPPVPAGKPDNYLVWAILTTLFCCLPFGIVSIVYSTKVDGLWTSGQYSQAQEASDNAKKWAIVAAVASVVAGILWFLFFVVFGVASSTPQ